MKEVKAIIQPFVLDKVLDALHEIPDLPGCTISDVRGYGRTRGKESEERALESTQKVKIEMIVPENIVKEVVKIIQENAKSGNRGDGKVFIIEVINAIAIRTGEKGEKAL